MSLNWWAAQKKKYFNIKSLNPIFWIKDPLHIVGGYLVDSSGNNKQIAAQIVTTETDVTGELYIQMPANDSDIINLLQADGTYYVFYTDDNTPKNIKFGDIVRDTDKILSYYCLKDFMLLPESISETNRKKLYEYWGKPYYDITLKNLNGRALDNIVGYNNQFYLDPPLIGASQNDSYKNLAEEIIDNNNSFSATKKTFRHHITSDIFASLNDIVNFDTVADYTQSTDYLYSNKFTLGFWINRALLTRSLAIYVTQVNAGNNVYAMSSSAAQLNSVGVKKSGNEYNVEYTSEVREIQGGWVYVQCKFKYNLANWVGLGSLTNNRLRMFKVRVALGAGTQVDQWVEYSDVTIVNDWVDLNRNLQYPTIEEVFNIPFFKGKEIVVVGDSVSVTPVHYNLMQRFLGINKVHNCAISGHQVGSVFNDTTWIPRFKETIAAIDADIWLLNLSTNDIHYPEKPIGTLQDALDNPICTAENMTFYRGYVYFLNYLIANIANYDSSKIILCVPGLSIKNQTPEQAIASFLPRLNDMRTAIYALASHYNLKVFDFFGNSSPVTWYNTQVYLRDTVHYQRITYKIWFDKFIKWAKANL